jgi:hypothetical protein
MRAKYFSACARKAHAPTCSGPAHRAEFARNRFLLRTSRPTNPSRSPACYDPPHRRKQPGKGKAPSQPFLKTIGERLLVVCCLSQHQGVDGLARSAAGALKSRNCCFGRRWPPPTFAASLVFLGLAPIAESERHRPGRRCNEPDRLLARCRGRLLSQEALDRLRVCWREF